MLVLTCLSISVVLVLPVCERDKDDNELVAAVINNKCFCFSGKIFIPKQKPVQTFTEETISLDPELEEALTSASDTELCDLAGRYLPRRGRGGVGVNECGTGTAFRVSLPAFSESL